ncbi:hypothetical protein [Candidatus Chlorohelix sp.]
MSEYLKIAVFSDKHANAHLALEGVQRYVQLTIASCDCERVGFILGRQ